jgi:alpha-beta hydrolase superfamily lysophospholipase
MTPDMTKTIESGDGEHAADINGTRLNVFTYRPPHPRQVLLVFHGMHRDAGPYRDRAKPLADRIGAIVVSPEFDAERFSIDLYQRGGVAPHGTFVPPGQRPVDLIAPLMAWARKAAGKSDLPTALIGHSAGGQFLSRVAAFVPTGASRLVIANPSTWVLPSVTDAVPYGFGGAPDAEASVHAYLALPITALLGAEDTGTENLSSEAEAVAQGPTRLQRGRNAFAKAKAAAQALGCRFGWTIAEVPGVGHDSAGMFSSQQAYEALR